jgi:flagellin
MLINGISINASLDTDDPASASTLDAGGAAIASSTKRSSAIAIAAAINKKTDEHGVRASAEANVVRGASFTGTSTDNGTIELNGVEITVSASNRDALVDRINEFTGQTGVEARAYGDALELVAEDGRNISIGSGLAAAVIGLGDVTIGTVGGAATHYASVKLESDKAFEIARGNAGTDSGNLESLGFRVGVFGGSDSGTKVADVDLTTQLGAQMAISAIDHAIDDVAASQARSGAFQNRLDSIVSILSESNENISAARSRILDTDYATETTALAKSQIVQQAATAMLAQANQQSQSVLALLQ